MRRGEDLIDPDATQDIRVVYEGKEVTVSIPTPHRLAVGDLQIFLDEWLLAHPGAKLDYVHGEQAVRDLVKGEGAVGFLLPAPDKSRFFEQVRELGVLPRKTFSMGEANESGIIWSAAKNKRPFAAETGRTALMKDPCALKGARVF